MLTSEELRHITSLRAEVARLHQAAQKLIQEIGLLGPTEHAIMAQAWQLENAIMEELMARAVDPKKPVDYETAKEAFLAFITAENRNLANFELLQVDLMKAEVARTGILN